MLLLKKHFQRNINVDFLFFYVLAQKIESESVLAESANNVEWGSLKPADKQYMLNKNLFTLLGIELLRSRIHERTISLRFLRLEVSVYNDYRTNQLQTTFARGGGGGGW